MSIILQKQPNKLHAPMWLSLVACKHTRGMTRQPGLSALSSVFELFQLATDKAVQDPNTAVPYTGISCAMGHFEWPGNF